MNTWKFGRYTPRWGTITATAVMLALLAGCATTTARAQTQRMAAPDPSIGDARFPDEDAVILHWEQHWTLDKDGTVHRRDHKQLKLLNRRPIRAHADPRLDFVNGQDELIFHKAQSILPDGTILPVPDYSFNLAGPDDVAGWPIYADWQQMVVSFSGIEAGVVLELDYEVVTPPGVLPWVEADLRLLDEYPTVNRIVSVTLPEGVALHYHADLGPLDKQARAEPRKVDHNTYRWEFTDLRGDPGEPQSFPWRQRSGRLRFTTCPGAGNWTSTMLDHVDRAGKATENIKQFAESVVEHEADQTQRVRKLAEKLHDSFNFITSPKAMHSQSCRAAEQVLQANYGNPLESAALLLAMTRALGMNASVAVGVDSTRWSESDGLAPTGSAFAGVVVVVDLPDGSCYAHPQHGVFKSPGHWGRHWLLAVDRAGTLQKTRVHARGETQPSELNIVGKMAVDTDGKATGELRIRLTGAFFDPDKLDTADAQEALVGGLVGRVLNGFNVASHSVVTLSDETFRATASVATDDAIKTFDKEHVLRFGDGPAFLADFPLPLGQSYRHTDVHLAGPLREHVDLTVELPEKWEASIVPLSLSPVKGEWGQVAQQVDVDGQNVRIRRTVEITTDTIATAPFEGLRQAVNELRTAQSLLLAFGK